MGEELRIRRDHAALDGDAGGGRDPFAYAVALYHTTPHFISYEATNKYDHTVYTLFVNEYAIADMNIKNESEFNKLKYDEYTYQNKKIKILNDLVMFANHAKILLIKDHPKWDKSYKNIYF